MTYIKDLIDLPDMVHRGDFVLRLTEGVTRPRETVENYVVTPQLAECFDTALGLIRAAVEGRSSKAAYLHGSFGSGKSHFMAILHLLLAGNPDARSIKDLAPIIAKHNVWTEGKRFLLVPYHMIGADDMESALLGGYAEHLNRTHPEAPLPGVYLADKIFEDARNLRASMGDEVFFARLNQSNRVTGNRSGVKSAEWGEIGVGWDAASFELAAAAPPKSEDRTRLVGDLVERFFTAARNAANFVDLDTGLSIISKHARALGYDGLILFLDELILWLASRAADVSFVNREGQKLAKLVESQTADRPTPIISFVARQRDLKELVGDHITGAEKLSFKDVLGYWEARFATIRLEDRNLAMIAQQRILKPKSPEAKRMIDDSFRETEKIREDVMNVLLTSQANRETFRQVYPFSPALVETLVAVSFLLQRERTALKVMLQLLVEQRDRLELGQIIPVGDLFDAISEGDEAFSDVMRAHFENALKLYHRKLRPLIEHEHKLTFDNLNSLPFDDEKARGLRADDRLAKTLLLSALAPEVESLRNLTGDKLAALNHGSIKSPIPGREGTMVRNKCRKWASEIGEIKISDDSANPVIAIQLTGVDTQSIIDQAESEDNYSNRMRKIKELLFAQLGVDLKDEMFLHHSFVWRSTKRYCDVIFGNVWEMEDDRLKNDGVDWRVIIDYPFDKEGRGPTDDISRVERFKQERGALSRTIIWIPSFLSIRAQKELGTFVKLDHILTGERYSSYVTRLPRHEHAEAKMLLENQRSQLKQRLIGYLEGVYGIANPEPGTLDPSYDLSVSDHFKTLDFSFELKPPVGANLKDSFHHLLYQALNHQFPAHPQFEDEMRITSATLKRVYSIIEQVVMTEDGRITVADKDLRKDMRLIANPLRLGEMAETHFVIGMYWKNHFLRKEAEHRVIMTVGTAKKWIDEPQSMGLPDELQNLIIMSFAAQTNRSFVFRGGPFAPTIETLPDELELHEQKLPAQADWETAINRGASIFGVPASRLLNATNVAKFVSDIKKVAGEHKASCDRLAERLNKLISSPTLALADKDIPPNRLKTARATKTLIDALLAANDNGLVERLAQAEIATTEAAMGTGLKKAADIVGILAQTDTDWPIFEAIRNLTDDRQATAQSIWQTLKTAFQNDELVTALAPALHNAKVRATGLLTAQPKPPDRPATQPTTSQGAAVAPNATPSIPGTIAPTKITEAETMDRVTEDELEQLFTKLRDRLNSDSAARLRITWEIYKS